MPFVGVRSTRNEYVPYDRMNNLIGPRQFGWSANFENLMKARAGCARAMKLSIPVKRTSPIAGPKCPFKSRIYEPILSLFYRPQTRRHVLNCPRNELSDPTDARSRWHRQCPTLRHSTHSFVSNRSLLFILLLLAESLVFLFNLSRIYLFHFYGESMGIVTFFSDPNVSEFYPVKMSNKNYTLSGRNNLKAVRKSMQKFIRIHSGLSLYFLPGEFIE